MRTSNQKLVIAGDYIHHYQYSHPINYDFTKTTKVVGKREAKSSDTFNFLNSQRTKRNIKFLVQANSQQNSSQRGFNDKPCFITLTFRDAIDTLQEANPLYKNFVKRLKYYLNRQDLKYLVVPEFQKLTRRAVHYHAIFFNFPYVDRVYDNIREIWQHGNINFQSVKDSRTLSNYIVKYITKQENEERLFNQKKYFTSRNLIKPQVFMDERRIANILELDKQQICSKNFYLQELSQSLQYTCYKQTQHSHNNTPQMDSNSLVRKSVLPLVMV